MSSVYFHWDITESDNYVGEIEGGLTNNKSGPIWWKNISKWYEIV
jgi:hypothetical protein